MKIIPFKFGRILIVLGANTQTFKNTTQPTGEIIRGKNLSVLCGEIRQCATVCANKQPCTFTHTHTHTQVYKVIHEL